MLILDCYSNIFSIAITCIHNTLGIWTSLIAYTNQINMASEPILWIIASIFYFHQVAQELNRALDIHFPASSGVRIIAEPGRYFVTSAFTLTVNIIAKRIVDLKNEDANRGTEGTAVDINDKGINTYFLTFQ